MFCQLHEPCHTQIFHVTHERVSLTWKCYKACQIYEWVKSHMNSKFHDSFHFTIINLCIAVCSVVQCVHCNTLQHTASRCNMLQHTATHCNALQHTATHCITLRHTATHCNTLQRTATHCNTLQHTATHCNTLQHTATHCSQQLWRWWRWNMTDSTENVTTSKSTNSKNSDSSVFRSPNSKWEFDLIWICTE